MIRENIKKIFILLLLGIPVFTLYGDRSEELVLDLKWVSFSPGSDSTQDVLYMSIKNQENQNDHVSDWSLEVKNMSEHIVRSFRAEQRLIQAKPALSNFFSPDPGEVRPLRIFNNLIWDGRDSEGLPVPDGGYFIDGWIQNTNGQRQQFRRQYVTIDRDPPQLTLEVERSVLRLPSEDRPTLPGERPLPIQIRQHASSNTGTIYSAKVLNEKGIPIFHLDTTNSLPEIFSWNGTRDNNDPVPQGVYSYSLEAVDPAGNTGAAIFEHILVSDQDLFLDLRKSPSGFSPNGDGQKDFVELWIEPVPERSRFLQNWNQSLNVQEWALQIKGPENEIVFERKGSGPFPASLRWDGRNPFGQIVSDGTYFAQFILFSSAGEIQTLPLHLNLDTESPRLQIHTSSSHFTPDGDGEEDFLEINLQSEDSSGIASWTVEIFSKGSKEKGLIQKFSGKGDAPESIVWRGSDFQGNPVDSFEELEIVCSVTDTVGNKTISKGLNVRTGALFRIAGPGKTELMVRIPSDSFFDPVDRLTDRGQRILDRIMRSYQDYQRYDMYIEVHSGEPGPEVENLLHTEQQAKAIRDYFLNNGIKESRMYYKGMGESEPIYGKSFNHLRYRNKRVQIRFKEKRI